MGRARLALSRLRTGAVVLDTDGVADPGGGAAAAYLRAPLPCGGFDVAVPVDVLHLYADDNASRMLGHVLAALRPGGVLAVVDAAARHRSRVAMPLAIETEIHYQEGMAPAERSLAAAALEAAVTVVAVHGERGFRRRLLELGFVPGAPVRVLRVAPLGDPLELDLRGCRLSVRRAEAAGIEVAPGPVAGRAVSGVADTRFVGSTVAAQDVVARPGTPGAAREAAAG
jgi:ferrous iron transport protein A